MRILIVIFVCVFGIAAVNSVEHIESELSQLPKLFHLDDYEKCLDKEDGIYCLGQFQLYSDVDDNPTYALIQKYATDEELYNRTYIHRGYCLSERCAGADSNLTGRFEHCVDKWAKYRHGLRARLLTLTYCQMHGQPPSNAPDTNDTPHKIFKYVVYFLLFMNIVGTAYDLLFGRKKKVPPMLSLWSLRVNYNRLTESYGDGDERLNELAPISGMRFLLIAGTVYAHSGVLTAMAYQNKPRYMEKFLAGPSGPMLGGLTTVTESFVVIANFLVAYNMLLVSEKHTLSFKLLPILILKRLIRMFPVYLLVNGFAATWWSSIGQGPMWPLLINRETAVCRRKFWATSFFLQNFFEPEHLCLIQTWIIAVDIQLYVLILILTLVVLKFRKYQLRLLSAMFGISVCLTTYVALKNNYVPAYTLMTPENFREYFLNCKSLINFYIMPINCLIAAVAGMANAFYHYSIQEGKAEKKHVWLHLAAIPLILLLTYNCYHVKKWITDPVMVSVSVIVERIIFCFIATMFMYGFHNHSSPLMKLFSWQALKPLARISMSFSMVHWCVNAALLASRHTLLDTSLVTMILDMIGTWVISNAIAVPLTLMVEYPVLKTLDRILMSFLVR